MLVGVFFLLCLPINILFNTAAVASAAVVAINRQAALSAPGVPTASFTGQGRGKVGLADYPRPPPNCSEDSEGCDISPAGSTSIDSTDDSSSDTQSTYSSSSSSRRGFGGGSALALFRGGYATVTFARASAATSNASSSSAAAVAQQQPPSASPATQPDQAAAVDSSSSSGSVLAAPAPAPALPWLTVVQERSKPPPLLGPGPSITAVKVAWRDQVSCRIQGLWRVDLLFNLWALPLQAASLLILPVFWTFPRLLGIQLSMPAAVLGGLRGSAALQESRRLMAGFKTSYAWPFVWLIVAGRLQEMLREVVLLAMPNRWWTDVPEVPLVVTALFFAVRMLLLRVQDLLPLAAYLLLVRQRKATAAADTASSSTSSCW